MRLLVTGIVLLLLAGCASPRGGYYEDDGPHRTTPDLSAVADAVPRAEPLSRGGNKPYAVNGKSYTPLASGRGYRERGVASWYGKKFHGRKTSNGESYDMYAMTAAHKTLPLPSYVRVRNLENGRTVVVRVNDRGPFLHNRIIDLSYAAANKLGIVGTGTGIVEVEAVEPGDRAPVVVAGSTETFAVAPRPRAIIEPIGTAEASPRETLPAVAPVAAAEPMTPTPAPRLYLQTGAFRDFDNASAMRTRLERAAFRPVFVQSVLTEVAGSEQKQRVYRVRIGPVATVEEGDRLTAQLSQHGVNEALIVVE